MEREPFVRVLGSADWLPTPDNDGASYVIDDRILIDTGWSAAVNMINHGMDPTNIDTICFTHMHADHYIGLTQMLLHRRIRCGTLEGLTILGPAPTVRAGFERAFAYIFHDSYDVTAECKGLPLIVPLHDGDGYETEHYRISVCDSDHAAPGLCYRFEHKRTGHAAGFTGDTRYRPEFGGFFKECDLLIHEASFGAGPLDPERNRICRHSSAQEAARVAQEAQVKRLLLTHAHCSHREAAVSAAQARLSIPVGWADPWAVFPF